MGKNSKKKGSKPKHNRNMQQPAKHPAPDLSPSPESRASPVPEQKEPARHVCQGVRPAVTTRLRSGPSSVPIRVPKGQPSATSRVATPTEDKAETSPLGASVFSPEQMLPTPTEVIAHEKMPFSQTNERENEQASIDNEGELGEVPFEIVKEEAPVDGNDREVAEEGGDAWDETCSNVKEEVDRHAKTKDQVVPVEGGAGKKEDVREQGNSCLITVTYIVAAAILILARTINDIFADGLQHVDRFLGSQRRKLFSVLLALESKIGSIVLGAAHQTYALQLWTSKLSSQVIAATKNYVRTAASEYIDPAMEILAGLGIKMGEADPKANAARGDHQNVISFLESVKYAMGYIANGLAEKVETTVENVTGNVRSAKTSLTST